MGLGEQFTYDLWLKTGIFSFWSRDEPDPISRGTLPGANNYGTHPYFLGKANDNSWFGVFTNLAAA